MAMFVHLTSESRVANIRRNGIGRLRKLPDGRRVIFAMPVTRNFYVSHQWLRELKRFNSGEMVGVYFRIDDDEIVSVGHYHSEHRAMRAAEAVRTIADAANGEGFEVHIFRKITAAEIHRVRILPQVIGWRYSPGSHGTKPCGCDYCQRGQYGARKLRERAQASSGRKNQSGTPFRMNAANSTPAIVADIEIMNAYGADWPANLIAQLAAQRWFEFKRLKSSRLATTEDRITDLARFLQTQMKRKLAEKSDEAWLELATRLASTFRRIGA